MLFNSNEFGLFFVLVFSLYWGIFHKNLRSRNLFILLVSYFFYGWWDWRFLSLIFTSSVIDYIVGLKLFECRDPGTRKKWLYLSLFSNLGMLGFFKYCNFFMESFIALSAGLGLPLQAAALHVILPVGISFYTFQTLSYTIDIYHGKQEPTRDIICFFAFVSFFPQLVAGPIERAAHLLPQFGRKSVFEYHKMRDGLQQILWGLFKKVVVADTCAVNVNFIFKHYDELSSPILFLGAVFFAFQIYGDFSGYSDMAIGVARLLGFNLSRNFACPYFSRNIGEFWRRWHMSLSGWFRDYVYIPLGGSRGSRFRQSLNVIVTFTLSGLWHGANWTFVIWGFLNSLYYIPLIGKKSRRRSSEIRSGNPDRPLFKELPQIVVTFLLTTIGWIFFRAESLEQAFRYLQRMLSRKYFTFEIAESLRIAPDVNLIMAGIFILLLLGIEWHRQERAHCLQIGDHVPLLLRWVNYYAFIILILYGFKSEKMFIYFQF